MASVLLDKNFPHYYSGNVNSSRYTNRYDDDPTAAGFVHTFFDEGKQKSDAFDVVMPYLFAFLHRTGFTLDSVLRVRSVLTLPTGHHSGFPHVDLIGVSDYLTAIVYVAGSDGDTILYDDRFNGTVLPEPSDLTEALRVTPNPNSGVMFNGLHYHTGLLPVRSKVRLVLNYNFTVIAESEAR